MIVLCADTHLDDRAWTARPTLAGDSKYSFQEIIKHAVENNAEAVICAGDMFDVRKPPSSVLEFFRKQMDILHKKNIPFYYIQGQHDVSVPPWANAVSDHPVLLDTAGIVTLPSGVTVSGFSWQPVDKLSEKLAEAEYSNIFVCHQVWREFMGDHIHTESSLANVPEMGLIFTGDFHGYRSVTVDNVFGTSSHVISPGSTNLRKINEVSEKYFVEAEVNGTSISFNRIKLNTRQLLALSILDELEFEEQCDLAESFVKSAAHPVLGKPIIYCLVTNEVQDGVRRLLSRFADRAHMFFKISTPADDTEVLIEDDHEHKLDTDNIAECLKFVLLESDPSYNPLHRLLSAEDFKVELQALRDEFLGKD